MISLILPYWNRQAAADRALRSLARYEGLRLEVIVVDDGAAPPFRVAARLPLAVKVLRLPEKAEPKSPVTPWNRGVAEAAGPWVVLSCVEILHTTPILAQLVGEAMSLGPRGIALAAAWCPDTREWHCHSTHRATGAPPLPPGTGRPFCAAMRKSFFRAMGGFDEAFRDGAGFEDMDWINRALAAGAAFSIRDDLVVTHPKAGAQIIWGAQKFNRNRQLYEEKWGPVTC